MIFTVFREWVRVLHNPIMDEAENIAATTLGPGRAPGGVPLRIHLGEPEYAALVRIARNRNTTAAHLVELLVLGALQKTDVPPPAMSYPKRPHTTYEQATSGFKPDE